MYNIVVVGGGVVGLTTAHQLQKDYPNVKVTIITDQVSPETTGDLSAGLWTPYLLQNTPEKDITKWSKVSHDYFCKLWMEGHAEKAGVCLQSMLRLHTDKDVEEPSWINIPFGVCDLCPEQVKKISKHHGRKYTKVSHFVSFTCEPSKLLPFLTQEFLTNGGNLIRKKIENFGELSEYDVIVNCTGLGSRILVPDNSVHPVRGQVSRVKAPWQYQVVMDQSCDGCYIIPNSRDVILGGTHQEHDCNLAISVTDKKRILEECAKMSPGLKTCKEYKDGVGLRPGRNKVRLEAEELIVGNKKIRVVHNYGHGGAGVTLCFGCAEDVSALVKQILHIPDLHSHL